MRHLSISVVYNSKHRSDKQLYSTGGAWPGQVGLEASSQLGGDGGLVAKACPTLCDPMD